MSLKDFESVFSKLYRSHGENLPKLLDTFFENLKKNKDDFLPEDGCCRGCTEKSFNLQIS